MACLLKKQLGSLKDGRPVHEYTLTNKRGMTVCIIDLGCTITRMMVPDTEGIFNDVVLGYDTLDDYLDPANPYFGCMIGRTANRIANHCITIDDTTWNLSPNHGDHQIHGGYSGFDKRLWTLSAIREQPDTTALVFTYHSAHLEEGYPGNLSVTTTMSLDDNDTLSIDYEAKTDQSTLVNLTHHPYFNLSGKPGVSCLDHFLKIHASRFTEPDCDLLPTGRICSLDHLAIDFRIPQSIGNRIANTGYPMEHTHGYDHNFILDTDLYPDPKECRLAAELYDPASGRNLALYTTQPCVQFYSGNFIPEHLKGRNQSALFPRAGLCLEPQGYPDASRHKQFESTRLEPGQHYHETTRLSFTARAVP